MLELIGVTETPAMKVDKAAEVIEKNSTKRFLSKGALKDKSRQTSSLALVSNGSREKRHNQHND